MKLSLTLLSTLSVSVAFVTHPSSYRKIGFVRMASKGPAGSFFNEVPDEAPGDDEEEPKTPLSDATDFDKRMALLLAAQQKGDVSAANGFGKSYTAIGPPDRRVNDVTKPEYDKDGYTLYQDEKTGEKSRVFEALVKYPCQFTMKIVGANEGTFVEDVVQIVADSCEVPADTIDYRTRMQGKWTSVTVKAPVASAEMLYLLYENIDKDPRVKFKF